MGFFDQYFLEPLSIDIIILRNRNRELFDTLKKYHQKGKIKNYELSYDCIKTCHEELHDDDFIEFLKWSVCRENINSDGVSYLVTSCDFEVLKITHRLYSSQIDSNDLECRIGWETKENNQEIVKYLMEEMHQTSINPSTLKSCAEGNSLESLGVILSNCDGKTSIDKCLRTISNVFIFNDSLEVITLLLLYGADIERASSSSFYSKIPDMSIPSREKEFLRVLGIVSVNSKKFQTDTKDLLLRGIEYYSFLGKYRDIREHNYIIGSEKLTHEEKIAIKKKELFYKEHIKTSELLIKIPTIKEITPTPIDNSKNDIMDAHILSNSENLKNEVCSERTETIQRNRRKIII